MPTTPCKASKLLQSGKAVVVRRRPFTIKLTWQCEANIQPITVGIDKGSNKTGFCAVSNGKILITGTINHRKDIKEKMDGRREHRRSRRNRKWHRPPRFNNRASVKRSDRLPPSVKANVEEVYRVICKLPIPISNIVIEDVQIDIARLNDPTLQGTDYQKSNRLDENLRIACLMRDEFTCTVCKKRGCRLEAHHVIPRSNGGKDTINNLTTLCDGCHGNVHTGKAILTIRGENGFKDRIAQRTMQGKTHLYNLLETIASVEKRFGYETSTYRKSLGLIKDHHIDALCLATMTEGESIPPDTTNYFDVSFRATQNRKQYYSCPKKGKGRVRYQVNNELEGFRKGDIVLVKDKLEKRIRAINSNGSLVFPYIKGEYAMIIPSHCRLLEKSKTIMFRIIKN